MCILGTFSTGMKVSKEAQYLQTHQCVKTQF